MMKQWVNQPPKPLPILNSRICDDWVCPVCGAPKDAFVKTEEES